MKWTTATALFLAISAAAVGGAVVLNRKPKSPEEILGEVRQEIGGVRFDAIDAIDRLQVALGDERTLDNPDLEKELRRTRADLLRQLDRFQEARTDLMTLAASGAERDRGVDLEIAELRALEGQEPAALASIRTLLQREPEFGPAWALRGTLEARTAETDLEDAYDATRRSLAESDAKVANELIFEMASRDIEDPRRDFLAKRLREAFYDGSDSEVNDVLRKVNEPRLKFERARRAFAKTLNFSIIPDVVVRLGELLESAGQIDLSILLHTAGRNIPAIRDDPDALTALLDQLLRANRLAEAQIVLSDWDVMSGGTTNLFRVAGEVLYRAEEWVYLSRVADALLSLGTTLEDRWGDFYVSVKVVALPNRDPVQREKNLRSAIRRLKGFVEDEDLVEPFFGAKDEAWFWTARAYRQLGDTGAERSALRTALERAPGYSAEEWVRFATLLRNTPAELRPWKDIEHALSNALNLDPSLSAELIGDWYEAGNQALLRRNVTLAQVIDDVERIGFSAIPAESVGPSVLTQVAEANLKSGNLYVAERAADAARESFRRLVPPLDVIIEAKLQKPGGRGAQEAIIERIESAGIDETVESFLGRLEGGTLQGKELVRAIQAAPRRFGKEAVARYYLTLKDPAKAGAALVGIDDESVPPQLRLLRARLLIEGEQFQKGLEELKRVGNQPSLRAEAILMEMEALVGAGRLRQLEPVVRRLLKEVNIEHVNHLKAVDLLSTEGRVDLALSILQELDKGPATRTSEFYRRRVLVDALALESLGVVAVRESILRSEAYLRDGTPEITSVVLAVKERQWSELPRLIDRLFETDFEPTPKQEAALLLLGERLKAGTASSTNGLRSAPRDADWAFLCAAAAALVDAEIELPPWFGNTAAGDAAALLRGKDARSPQDPRDALILYLMSSEEAWSSWVIPRINQLTEATGSTLWTQWLKSRIYLARGETAKTKELVDKLIQAHPRFGPGHDLSVRIVEEASPTEPLHPDVVRARRVRVQSLGEDLIEDPIEIRLALAGELARKGKNEEAVQLLQPVISKGGIAETEGRLILGILMIRSEQYSFAAKYLNSALERDPGVFQEVVIDSLLFALRRSVDAVRGAGDVPPQRDQLTEAQALALLDRLSISYPMDPMVALATLELDPLGEGERGALAEAILERLFTQSGRKTLDQLRRGCTTQWIEFLSPIAPDVATKVLARDLVLEPGNLDLWQLAGYVAEERDATREAMSYYNTLMDIDARADTGFALARLMIEDGASAKMVNGILARADRGQAGGSAKGLFLRTLAEMRSLKGGPTTRAKILGRVIQRLREQWKSRERIRREVDPLELGLLYAEALFRRLQLRNLDVYENSGGRPDTDMSVEARSHMAELKTLLGDLKGLTMASLYADDVAVAMDGIRSALEKRMTMERQQKSMISTAEE